MEQQTNSDYKYKYKLMYKEKEVINISFDTFWNVRAFELGNKKNKQYIPFAAFMDDKINLTNFSKWLNSRFIPKNREGYDILQESLHVKYIEEKVIETHAASLFDSYWIKRSDEEITWEEVSQFNKKEFKQEPVEIFLFKKNGSINLSSPTLTTPYPENCLWQIVSPEEGIAKKPCLVEYKNGESLLDEYLLFLFSQKAGIPTAQIRMMNDHGYACASKSFKAEEGRTHLLMNTLFNTIKKEADESIIGHTRKVLSKLEIKDSDVFIDKLLLISYLFSMPIELDNMNVVITEDKREIGPILFFKNIFSDLSYNPMTGQAIENNLAFIKDFNEIEALMKREEFELFGNTITEIYRNNDALELGKVKMMKYQQNYIHLLRYLKTKKELESLEYDAKIKEYGVF